MPTPETDQIKRALLRAAAQRTRTYQRHRRRALAAATSFAAVLLIGSASVLADVGPLAGIQNALTQTPAEVGAELDAAGPGDAAVNAAGPGMIRCDQSYRCIAITPSGQAMAEDAHVYVRVVHGGLTPARLAIGTALFPSAELFCQGTTTLTCTPASEQAPTVPPGVTAIAGYVHQHVKVTGKSVAVLGPEPPLVVAPIAG